MNKIFSKFSLLITIGLLSILFSTDYTFAQNPGNALDFDGSNDYVSIPDATALDITDQITIEAWFKPSSSSWAYKKLITIDYTKVSATLTDFPVLVSVTDVDLKDTDNGGPIQPDGDDILFLKTDGTKLSHEIEEYDGSTGELVAWVKIPSLSSSTDTEIYLYYGNSSCSSQQDAANVWDSNYKGVWHLNDDFLDATSNDNDGTNNGSTDIAGKVSDGQDFDGTNDYVDGGTPNAFDFERTDEFSVSIWLKRDRTGITERFINKQKTSSPHRGWRVVLRGNDVLRFALINSSSGNGLRIDGTTTITSTTNWYHIAISYSGLSNPSSVEMYINGVREISKTTIENTLTATTVDNTAPFHIGIRDASDSPFDGLIDEIRISSTVRDSSWIGTEYRNQNSPGTFMSFSNQTAAGVSKSLAYGISTNNSKAYGTINNQGVSGSITAGEWNHISLTYDKDAGGTDEIKLYLNGTQSATGDYATAISTNNNNLLLGDMVGFLGKMDEIRIWNDVRTQQEIRDNMHRIVTPGSETNLVAYWKLNESSGTSAPDSKGSNTGTLFNMTDGDWVASTAPFGGGLVNSTTSFTSGTANLGTFSLTTTNSFDNPVDITSTEILNAPNVLPSIANPLDDRYWVVDVFGTPGTYTANLTFTLPSGYLDLGDEANLNLYNRSSNNDGSWTLLISGAASMTATTVTFDGVSTLGQFTIGSSGSPLPVELVSFTGKVRDQKVYLKWSTATEVNNYGFDVERKVSSKQLAVGNWEKIGFVEGHGNSNSQKEYSFTDAEVNSSGIYYYRLKQIDNDGAYEFSNQIEVNFNVPIKFELSQNYPNPFNPSTTISFTLAVNEIVSLSVYNMLGEEIQILQKGFLEAGMYSYNFNAEGLPSGFYIYKLSSNNKIQTRKMLLLK
ncbi:MAG: DUF2341 domain-containing protein [Bacteroidetes bacterium]|nr:DUF2341 domain-containing protein [Bacteroidota bacterium]